eukprot:jgi/Botrbrau1/16258/Bobra.0066s0042.2
MRQRYIASRRGQPSWAPPTQFDVARLQALKVGAVVFYGQRQNLRLLNGYLERNLASAGGLLHEVVFVITTDSPEDLGFLETLLQRHPVEYRAVVKPKDVASSPGLASSYLGLYPSRLYIKIDDNILYFQDSTVRALVEAKLAGRYSLVSANLVNHEQLSAVHAHMGAILPFEPVVDVSRWCWESSPDACEAQGLLPPPAKCSNQQCEWRLVPRETGSPRDWLPHDVDGWKSDWKCAALAHFSFLQRWREGTLDSYYFRAWDLSIGQDKCCACPSHFLIFNSSHLPPDLLPPDHVIENMDCGAVGEGALAAHYAYGPQEERLTRFTSVFQHYEAVADIVTGGLAM